ncbi:MAG: YicC/YloC family endoribonuclease [Bacillota bacterium]|nr:YicC/YloC family endoribonuclease [Bacillota bacterium]
MIKSMTGFGSGEITDNGWNIRVEVKAVNHRYSEAIVRLPRQFSLLEETVRAQIQKKVTRGRIEAYLNFEETEEKKSIVKLDKDLAVAYYKSLKELSGILDRNDSEVTAIQLAQLPEVIAVKEEDIDFEVIKELVIKAMVGALAKLNKMRETEGEELTKDLSQRLAKLVGITQQIKERSPKVVKEYQDKINERIKELLVHIPLDENRLAMEIAVFADKCNIDEELVRLDSHCHQFNQSLASEEAVGRKLDFLVQEMNREVNTIGSKANDLTISHLVVEAKSELEKIREQVQNIE